jgi:hypothetical protein
MTITSTHARAPAVADLHRRFDGDILLPGDEPYDSARQSWNLSFEHRPAVVAIPVSVSDVVQAVLFARSQGLHVVVHATGHGVARPAAAGALLLVMSGLDDVRVDPVARRAWVGGGSTWAPVLALAQAHGLAPLLGSTPHVGAVGYTLGGGMGWLARKYGLSSDSVRRFEVVTADGGVVYASPTEEPELFWGLRGAGAGSLGVVTGMEVALYPVTSVYGGSLFYPAALAGEVLARWRDRISTVPDELTSAVALVNFPPLDIVPPLLRGQSFAVVRGCCLGPHGEGEALMRHWRRWRVPALDVFGTMPFAEVASISQDPVDPIPARATAAWLSGLTATAIDVLVAGTFPGDAPPALMATEVRHAGGAISRPDPASAAYGNRDAALSLEMVGLAPTPEHASALEAHTRALRAALGDVTTGGQYLNFLEGEEKRRSAVTVLGVAGAHRAARLKAAVDPEDLFDHGLDLVGVAGSR